MIDPTRKTTKGRISLDSRLLAYAAAIPMLAVAGAGTARAGTIGFTGPYAFDNWTQMIGGDGSIVDGSPSSVTLIGSDTGSGNAVDVDFTIVSVDTGFVSFSWTWTNSDSSSYDFAQWLQNGMVITLTGASPSAGGQALFPIQAGDVIGFRVYSDDDMFGRGTLAITDFATSSIPEPSTLSLMILGAAGLLAARRRRKKA